MKMRFLKATAVLFTATVCFAQKPVLVPLLPAAGGSLAPLPAGSAALADPEIDPATAGGDTGVTDATGQVLTRTVATREGRGPAVLVSSQAPTTPNLVLSFDGLSHFDTRTANGGNQFSLEPPDQGLCVGNGFVVESVNTALRVFDTNGNPLTGVVDLNTFYGYPAAINRTTGAYGPEITDPSCYYDKDTQRWFHIVLTLDRVGTTSALSGINHIDIAVSTTSSPLGPWRVYKIAAQNDGTGGTPNHHCVGGPCLGDYPHIGADANAIFITTNEFDFFGPNFEGAQIYAVSRKALTTGAPGITASLFNTGDPSVPFPGFTVWPAISGDGVYATGNGGTEYLLSSLAVFEDSGNSSQLVLWKVKNTSSIDAAPPALALSGQYVNVDPYGVPPQAGQKTGFYPLGQCLSDRTLVTPVGNGCWLNFFGSGGRYPNRQKLVDANDSRMQQVILANGKLWGALDTALTIGTDNLAGIAYYVLDPVAGSVFRQGYVGVQGNNVTYPAIAVNGSGQGVMAFTLLGTDYFPSAAYVTLDQNNGTGFVHVAATGAGPDDGFTGYNPYGGAPRWGDYGAAVFDGTSFWIASEYVGQTCTLSQYLATSFVCSNTRTSLANWGTRISKLQ